MPRIVFAPKLPKALIDLMLDMAPPGFDVVVVDPTSAEFREACRDAEYYMGFARTPLGPDFYAGAKKMKLVQLISAGYNTVDIEAASRAGVPVANNGGANAVAVAEHTVMLMLATLKRLAWLHNNVHAGRWRVGDFSDTRLYELADKTVGFVGFGNIGKKTARRLCGFDCRLLYYDIIRLAEHEEDALGVKFALFDELLRCADVVSLHVPLTAQTQNMIGERELALMKPTAVLINTCRGPVVDESALHKALLTKQIAGAGLDVMVDEPPPRDHPLLNADTCTITPHMAGPTWDNWPKTFRNAFDNILRVHDGRAPLWVIPELRPPARTAAP